MHETEGSMQYLAFTCHCKPGRRCAAKFIPHIILARISQGETVDIVWLHVYERLSAIRLEGLAARRLCSMRRNAEHVPDSRSLNSIRYRRT